MRRGDLGRVVEALRAPVEDFVQETRVRTALLINGAGQVLARFVVSGHSRFRLRA